MNTDFLNPKGFVLILVAILIVTFGTQSISYAQEANPTITASVEEPLTEATLHESVVTLTLSGGRFVDRRWRIEDAISFSGIDGVTVDRVERVSGTVATVELEFAGNIDIDATLTFTVEAGAIVEYNGNALTATLPVSAVEESLEASTEVPLTEATLDGSTITVTLNGRRFDPVSITSGVSVSGIEGVTFDWWDVERIGDTGMTIELKFAGNIDTNATLTFTVEPGAIGYSGNALTATLPVTAIEESLEASTAAQLTEATLDGSIITLTLKGRQFNWGYIRNAVSVSGIDGASLGGYNSYGAVERVSDTVATVELEFKGDIDEDATLTLTVGPEAIVGGYDKPFTFQFPVTAVEGVSLEASAALLTEATLDGGIITLTLTGRRFADYWRIKEALSISGIGGVTLAESGAVERVSDTVATVELEFDGTDFDTDATLTLTVGADAISYNKDFTFQFPVTAIQQSNATVSISPASIVCPDVGEQLTFSLNIAGGENIAGYQATLSFNPTALRPVNITNGDYLPMDAFFRDKSFYREVRLVATTLAGASNGAGTLATLTFEVEDFKASTLTLSEVYLVDADGKRWEVTTESAEVTIPPEPENVIFGDINRDGVVNIQDLVIVNVRFGQTGKNSADINGDRIVNIIDLVLVAGAFGNDAAAPALHRQSLETITVADIQRWLSQAQQLELTDATSLRGILFLEQLLAALIPEESALLSNYPNPFNPETWIPYRLSKPADVILTIYAVDGQVIRRLSLGHQPAGMYQNRSRAAHWDGKNEFGESVASGLYFYTLTAGGFTATRKMLIRK